MKKQRAERGTGGGGVKTCKDFFPHKKGFLPIQCCSSCHEDVYFGYVLMSATDDFNDESEVCCGIRNALEKKKQPTQAGRE